VTGFTTNRVTIFTNQEDINMIRRRTKSAEPIAAEPDDDQAPEPEAAPDDLAGRAEELRARAAESRGAAEQDRAKAQDQVTAAREAAAQLVRRPGAAGAKRTCANS